MTDAARKPEAVASRERAAEDVAQSYEGDCEARSDDCDCPHCALVETTRDVLILNTANSRLLLPPAQRAALKALVEAVTAFIRDRDNGITRGEYAPDSRDLDVFLEEGMRDALRAVGPVQKWAATGGPT